MNNNDTNMNGMNPNFNSNGTGMNPNQLNNQPTGMENLEGMSLGNVGNVNQPIPDQNVSAVNSTPTSTMNNPMNPVHDVGTLGNNINLNASFESFSNPTGTGNGMNVGMSSNATDMNSVNMNPTPSLSSDAGLQQNTVNPMNVNPMNVNSVNSMNQPISNPTVNTDANMNSVNSNTMESTNMNNNPNFNNPNLFAQNATGNAGMNNNIFETVPTPPSMNDFNTPNKKGGKFKFSKTTIIIVVVLLIAIIGAGIYLVLNTVSSKPKGTIAVNDLMQWELGKELSTNVSDYATITGFDKTVCSLDVSKVDVNKMGSYDFTVTCGTTSKSGKIILQDKKAPEVVVREVVVLPGSTVTVEDFIVACNDVSHCTYAISEDSGNLSDLTLVEGVYNLKLTVSDDYDNKTTVDLKLTVTMDAPVKYMFCTPASTTDDTLNASVEITYTYGINSDDELVQTQKVQKYTFDDQKDYLNAKNNYDTLIHLDGAVAYDDSDFVIQVINDLTETELNTEFNVSSFPTNYTDLKTFNVNQGISCKNR